MTTIRISGLQEYLQKNVNCFARAFGGAGGTRECRGDAPPDPRLLVTRFGGRSIPEIYIPATFNSYVPLIWIEHYSPNEIPFYFARTQESGILYVTRTKIPVTLCSPVLYFRKTFTIYSPMKSSISNITHLLLTL